MTVVARSFLALTAQANPSQVPQAWQAPRPFALDPIDGEREPERRQARLAGRSRRCAG